LCVKKYKTIEFYEDSELYFVKNFIYSGKNEINKKGL